MQAFASSSQSIGQRMALVLGLVLALACVGSGIGYVSLVRIASDTREMLDRSLTAERVASDWYRNITNGVNRTSAIAVSADPSLAQFFAATAAESTRQSSEYQKQLEALLSSDRERELFDKLSQARKQYLSTRDAVSAAKKAGESERASSLFEQAFQPAAQVFQASMQAVVQHERAQLDEAAARIESANQKARWALLAFAISALLAGVALAVWLARSITRPLAQAVEVAEAISRFNLTSRIEVRSQDETGRLLTSLAAMQSALQELVRSVRVSTDSISVASTEIASGNMDLSSRTEQTASSLQEAAASMMQLTGTVRQTADSAATANQLASSAAEVAQRGGVVVSEVVSTMEDISASSRRIGDIIGTIDGIAFQTNILALNAAVEAARAGEQGRGFAVVAGEVRSLAQRSAEAAREIKALIGASVDKVESGARLVKDAGQTMTEIVSSVQRVTDIIGEITAAAQEQREGIDQINVAVSHLDQMTQQNAALVEEAASAAESLKDQSVKLAEEVTVFKL